MSGFIHGESGWACNEKNANTAPIPFIDSCDDCALEAWERMTTGGITVSRSEYVDGMDLCSSNVFGELWSFLAAR